MRHLSVLLRIVAAILFTVLFVLFPFSIAGDEQKKGSTPDIIEIEKRINAFVPDGRYPDDPFVLVAVQEALAGFKEKNGGVGACLVQESTGKIVERGHVSIFPNVLADSS